MSPIDIILLAVIGAAFIAVVLRIRHKGTCGDCGSTGSCSGSCSGCSASRRGGCPAAEGADEIADRLGCGL